MGVGGGGYNAFQVELQKLHVTTISYLLYPSRVQVLCQEIKPKNCVKPYHLFSFSYQLAPFHMLISRNIHWPPCCLHPEQLEFDCLTSQ